MCTVGEHADNRQRESSKQTLEEVDTLRDGDVLLPFLLTAVKSKRCVLCHANLLRPLRE